MAQPSQFGFTRLFQLMPVANLNFTPQFVPHSFPQGPCPVPVLKEVQC